MAPFSFDTWFAVRYVHVASIALLAGGAFASLALCVSAGAGGSLNATLAAATVYERVFWLVAGVTVATGISNLGLKGDGSPSFAAIWSCSAAHDPTSGPTASARR